MLNKICILITMLISQQSFADLTRSTVFSLNTIYLDRDYTDNGVTNQSKITDTDLRITRVEKNWSYGAIYALSSNDASNANRTSYGLSVGYYSEKDFYLNFNYFLASKYSFGNSSEYSKGNGYEFDLGFLTKVTSSFYAGLLIGIKNFSYTEQTISGVKTDISASHREVLPMFTFAVNFM